MKQTINEYQFIDGFSIRPSSFSYEGLHYLFEYLEQLEEDGGEEFEYDPIALCCEYTEYEDLAEFQSNYGDQYQSIEDIEDESTVIRMDETAFIVADF